MDEILENADFQFLLSSHVGESADYRPESKESQRENRKQKKHAREASVLEETPGAGHSSFRPRGSW
ncbi:hypothetical protein [Herbidospora sp. NBRC 101105]|uniref:hypothetical protein n=1 Tax=Herbidospora sp. NBRC 101105 TaxID=3032195 RepID=UPI0025551A6D|nr:hypothetical protein [Herbidospora sp. NBRC 101105]